MGMGRKLNRRWNQAFEASYPNGWTPKAGDLVWVRDERGYTCVQRCGNVVSVVEPDWLLVVVHVAGGYAKMRPYIRADVRPRGCLIGPGQRATCAICKGQLAANELAKHTKSVRQCWKCASREAMVYWSE